MEFTSKLTEADLNEVRRITHPKMYIQVFFRVAVMAFLGGELTLRYMHQRPPNWNFIIILWATFVCTALLAVYLTKKARAEELAKLNATRPDQICLFNDGVKCEGPNGATTLLPWRNFKSWREGQRVVLVERSEGHRYFILPVAQLSETERTPLRQFLQSHISAAGQ